MSYYREQLESYLKEIDVKAKNVCDVGGGSNPVNTRVKSWDVETYEIWDNGIEQQMQNALPIFKRFDLNTMIIGNGAREKFDIVFCLEVFEYIWNPVLAMNNLYDLLKKGGDLYISFPFIYPIHNPSQYDFLRYTQKGIERIMEQTGFESWELYNRIQKGNLNIRSWFSSEGMHPAKGEDHNVVGYFVHAEK